ncbi:hypothetical protein [uncultured Litoreibacter sp.]|uniref:hypothetical protein n=1 Tax=uncultured Litoreibacter sp. TaxID=1392394 RepID=UPI002630F8E8|nr:hypothetical protein [uncultured Litoreibacter sp.]
MMGEMLVLEDFGVPGIGHAPVSQAVDLKAVEKGAFDAGYKDGWNDAFEEARTEEGKAQKDIAIALQELGFTYFEARQHILGSFRPLLDAMLHSVLPKASQASLTAMVQQEMTALAEMVEPPIQILCSPINVEQLTELVSANGSPPVNIVAEETLAPSQIQLRYADGFSTLDTEATVKRIQDAVGKFFAADTGEEMKHA